MSPKEHFTENGIKKLVAIRSILYNLHILYKNIYS